MSSKIASEPHYVFAITTWNVWASKDHIPKWFAQAFTWMAWCCVHTASFWNCVISRWNFRVHVAIGLYIWERVFIYKPQFFENVLRFVLMWFHRDSATAHLFIHLLFLETLVYSSRNYSKDPYGMGRECSPLCMVSGMLAIPLLYY